MSNDKRDLTRIEDLAEFIHELESSDVPELPGSEEPSPFDAAFNPDELENETTETPSETPPAETQDFNAEVSEPDPFAENSEESAVDAFSTDFEAPSFEPESAPLDTPEFEAAADFESPAFDEEQTEAAQSEVHNLETVESIETPELHFDEKEQKEDEPAREEYAPEAHGENDTFQEPETFSDVKKFAENTSFTGMGVEGNPSFSVLIKNVRYIEDVNDIITLLKELNLLSDSEDQMKARLMRGSLLVPRISEFAGIYLSHKLRRFDVDIQLGLSDEIHPPKHQENAEVGLVSKFNLLQNQSHHFSFDNPKVELGQIILSATSTLEGYQVVKYMGVASEHKLIEGHIVEDESSDEIPRHYQDLAVKLKAHAVKHNSNAVVGLNYQLTPIPTDFGLRSPKYRLTCTGNLVWVNKL